MKQKIFLILILFLSFTNSKIHAQKYMGNWEKTEEDKKESKKFGNNIFIIGGFTPALSLYNYSYVYLYEDSFGNDPVEEKRSDRRQAMAILELETGIRYNFFNYHDFFSMSLSITPSLALMDGGAGTLGINTPISLDFNLFNHSTFNNINNAGFSLSLGMLRHHIYPYDYINLKKDLKWNDLFGRFTFKYRKYKSSFNPNTKKGKYYYSYFAVQYGFSNQTLTYGTISEIEKFTSFKIVFGKIFRY